MGKGKTKTTVTLALALGLTYTTAVPSVTYAKQSLGEIKDETAAQKSLQASLTEKQKAVQAELDKINKKQLDLTGKIGDTQEDINRTKEKITELQKEIKAIQQRIEERKDLLNDRLVSIYKNGGSVNYLEVLLGSKDFGDFLDRSKALYTITTQDKQILTDQQKDKEAVSNKKLTVEKKQAENLAKMDKLREAFAQVEELQKQKKTAAAALDSKQEDVKQKLSSLASAAADIERQQAEAAKNANKSQNETIRKVSYSPASASSNRSSSSDRTSKNDSSFTLSTSVSTGGIQGILNYGNKFIGRSTYVWGASNPSAGKFDCSGFVNAAFAANGIRLGGGTSSLVYKGTPVSYSSAKPGDLIFFDTYKKNGHVGIYLGGGRFIGSQSSTGVAVVSMSNPYWKTRFSGVVRRVLN